MKEIIGLNELQKETDYLKGSFILGIFGTFSEKSMNSKKILQEFSDKHKETRVYSVDVGKVKDVHKFFGVTEVPMILKVENARVTATVAGFEPLQILEKALGSRENISGQTKSKSSQKVNNIAVYTTSSCPWCTKVKDYLKNHGLPFREINVENQPEAGMQMQRATGQRGVPQLNINGSWVVGFDKAKIDRLLGISNQAQERM